MPEATPVRKRVTILFSDVAGSTALGESLDAEPLVRLMSRYFEEMRAVIERHGGQVAKFIGDAVMAVFGIPTVREDDALRAVRAAVEMRERLKDLNEELRNNQGVIIEVRTAINTGEVLAGTAVGEALALGDPVNVAARLEQAAHSGAILLGEATYDLVKDAVTVEEMVPLVAKGKARSIRAYRLLDVARHAPGVARRLSSPLVGRDEELSALNHAFEQAVVESSCRLVTIVGEAGLGKSRLTAEFIGRIRQSASVIQGRCLSYGEGITFWPLAEAVKQAAGIIPDDEVGAAVGKIEKLLSKDSDAATVARHLATAIGLQEGDFVIEETYWAARRLFESMAAARPLAVVFDDIHWAEPTFLDFLEYVRGFSTGRPILLLCQSRPDLFDRRPEWRNGSNFVLRLQPLSQEESNLILDNLSAGTQFDEGTRERITDMAEGNPLFVEEILRMMADQAQGSGLDGRGTVETLVDIPPTIHALLDARLEALPSEERVVLQHASVIGKEFSWGAVADLTPKEDRGRLVSLLQALVRRDLIHPDSISGQDAFRFSHILVRDAAYRGLPKESRARLHRAVAAWIAGRAGERLAEYEEIMGYHLEQAVHYRAELGAIGVEERVVANEAATYLISAGQRAVVRGDNTAIINLLSRAAALLDPDDPRRLRVLPDLADALDKSGDLEASKALFAEAISRSESIGNEPLRAHATVMHWLTNQRGETEALAEAKRALEVFEVVGDELGLSRAWRLVSVVNFELGRGGDSDAALEKALRYARKTGHGGELGSAYGLLSQNVTRGPMPVGDGIARCEEILAQATDSRWITGAMCHVLAHLRARWGDFDEARELVRRYRETRRDLGWTASYWITAEVEGDVELLAGQAERAVEVMNEAYERYRELTGEDSQTLAAFFLARALYQVNRIEEAEMVARVAVASPLPLNHHLGVGLLATIMARQGDFDQAEMMALQATTFFEQTDFLTDHATVLVDLAEVLRMAGRPDEARDAIGRAILLHQRKDDRISLGRAEELLQGLAS